MGFSYKKIVVTGALGHIGSRLIRDLPSFFPDAEIWMADNMLAQRYCSLFELPRHARYRFQEIDVAEADLSQLLQGADAVIHLAAITNAEGSVKMRDIVEKNNLGACKNVALAAAAAGARMFNVSSTSVYGTADTTVDESCSADDLKPQSPYAESKLREEKLLRDLALERNLRFVTCRFGTIFGTSPGMRFHTAVNKFCWQAVMGQPITVWRTALNQKRPYLDLADAIRTIHFFLDRDLFSGDTYNALTLNTTVGEIVDLIRKDIPNLRVELVDSAIMNQLSYDVSDAKLRNTGFTPKGSLSSGIQNTLALLRGANALS